MFQRQPWMQRAGEFPADDGRYHELLARAVFSAGLGPRVVESRWAGIAAAFGGLDPGAVAALGEEDVARLLGDPGVIRNRRKIEAVIENAGRFLSVAAEHGGFHHFVAKAVESGGLESAAGLVAESFRHLGPASAALFLFSAGWRAPVDRESSAEAVETAGPAGPQAPGSAPERTAESPGGSSERGQVHTGPAAPEAPAVAKTAGHRSRARTAA